MCSNSCHCRDISQYFSQYRAPLHYSLQIHVLEIVFPLSMQLISNDFLLNILSFSPLFKALDSKVSISSDTHSTWFPSIEHQKGPETIGLSSMYLNFQRAYIRLLTGKQMKEKQIASMYLPFFFPSFLPACLQKILKTNKKHYELWSHDHKMPQHIVKQTHPTYSYVSTGGGWGNHLSWR